MKNLSRAPEFTTRSGRSEHKAGDGVRLRDPLPDAVLEWGIVVVVRGDWFVVWQSGRCQSFDEIRDDELEVFSSFCSFTDNDWEQFNPYLDDGVTRVRELLSEGES